MRRYGSVIGLGDEKIDEYRFPALLSFPLAVVLAACAAGGIGMHMSIRMTGAGTGGAPLAPLLVRLALIAAALAGMLRRLRRAGTAT